MKRGNHRRLGPIVTGRHQIAGLAATTTIAMRRGPALIAFAPN